MAEQGLIEAAELGPRDRRVYQLTAAGREAFQNWLEQPPGEEQIRYPLLLTLAFARHLEPAQLTAFLAQHRAIHAARLAAYRAQHAAAHADGASPADLVILDFGLRYETAVLEWFDHIPHHLTTPETGTTATP